jgi:UDP-N-acetylglucosamine 4-epimerase
MIRDELARDRPELAKVNATHEPPRPGDVPHSQASIEKITKELGYVPTHQIADGMAETVTWFTHRRMRQAS